MQSLWMSSILTPMVTIQALLLNLFENEKNGVDTQEKETKRGERVVDKVMINL